VEVLADIKSVLQNFAAVKSVRLTRLTGTSNQIFLVEQEEVEPFHMIYRRFGKLCEHSSFINRTTE